MRWWLFFALVMFTAPTAQAEDSPTEAAEKAKQAYEKAIAAAKASYVAGLEAAEKLIKAKTSLSGEKKLARLKQLATDKEGFEKHGYLSPLTEMKSYIGDYNEAMGRAERAVKSEFDKAIDALAKEGEFDKASPLVDLKRKYADDSDERKRKADCVPLLGKWSVECGSYRAQWTFTASGEVSATEGGSTTGKWRYEPRKKRILITWDGIEAWDSFTWPPKGDGTAVGDSWSGKPVRAVKEK